MTTATQVLSARDVSMRFGGLLAVNAVSLDIEAGEIVGIIGPNGAGKTTFFNCLTGLYSPTGGSVVFRGQPVATRPDLVTASGIARTFQNIRLFPNMTVLENVLVGRHSRIKQSAVAAMTRWPSFRRSEVAAAAAARSELEFVGLASVEGELAKNLPYGDQRRLEIARALATEPGLLLLDEPTAGMNPQETRSTQELVRSIRQRGISVVVIEHDTRFIFGLCDRVAVLVQGAKLVEGTPAVVQSDPRVIEAYIGSSTDTDRSANADSDTGKEQE
jgi:branched-chain amino acid transport system ATP-binding protein